MVRLVVAELTFWDFLIYRVHLNSLTHEYKHNAVWGKAENTPRTYRPHIRVIAEIPFGVSAKGPFDALECLMEPLKGIFLLQGATYPSNLT